MPKGEFSDGSTSQLALLPSELIIELMKEICTRWGRKAQRSCPAQNNRICSQCCGRSRGRAIVCPDTCPHFVAGARTALRRLAELSSEPRVELDYSDLLHNLRLALVQLRRTRLANMTDGDAQSALNNVADTMRTRQSGLIYEFRSPDPRIQLLTDSLLDVAGRHERGEGGLNRYGVADIRRCLLHQVQQIKQLAERGNGSTGWLELISQTVGHKFTGNSGIWLVQR